MTTNTFEGRAASQTHIAFRGTCVFPEAVCQTCESAYMVEWTP